MNKKFNSVRYAKDFSDRGIDSYRVKTILSLIGNGKNVLDLGCGDGFIMERIEDSGNKVEGVEIAEPAIKKARKKGFKVYDMSLIDDWAHKLKQKYDVILAGEIIEHVFDTDKFLQNIRKALKPGGFVIVTTPNIASLGRRLLLLLGKDPLIEVTARAKDAGHIRYFTRERLVKLLKENDFCPACVSSSVVNFGFGCHSRFLAKLFPSLGNNIIAKADKV